MKVLVLCDDYWHPGSVVRDGLAPLEGASFSFDIVEDAAEWSAELMAAYPVVLFAKSDNVSAKDRSSWASETVQQAFVDYVRAGNGLLAMHSGTVYEKLPVMRGLIGGAFLNHPKQCPVTVEPQAGYPLAAGVTAFTETDEHYMMVLDDEDADVFLMTTSEHGTQPGGWTRTEGGGRVCVLTPGHNVEVWLEPSFQVLIGNALRWCSRM